MNKVKPWVIIAAIVFGFLLFFLAGCSQKTNSLNGTNYNYSSGEYLSMVKETKYVGNYELLKKDIQELKVEIKLSDISNNQTLKWLKQVKNISSDSKVCFTDQDCRNNLKCIGQCKVVGGERDGWIYACRLDDWIDKNRGIEPIVSMGICLGDDKWQH